MRLRTLRSARNLRGKRVLVRIDANVPLKSGKVVDGPHGKIARAAVDLEWLRQHGAKLIVATHLGRPNGKRSAAYSVAPVARRLSELLGTKVRVSRELVGPKAERMAAGMESGDVMMIENARFHPGEEGNSRAFARQLAALADVYVNDAFAVSHRAHASVDAITEELPSYAGPLLEHEVSVLGSLHASVKHPFVLVMGGLKMTNKLPVLERFLPHVDSVLIGGALAHAFFLASGRAIGRSAFEKEGVPLAKKILKKWGKKIRLPEDVYVVKRLSSQAATRLIDLREVGPKDFIVDVGRRTMRAFVREIQNAKTVAWNGPFGYCEIPKFCAGTHLLARAIAARTGKAKTIVGGGDTVPVIETAQLVHRFTLVSTGGGAMLEFMSGKKLPGLSALEA
jgi:phosphoglycerate kinase